MKILDLPHYQKTPLDDLSGVFVCLWPCNARNTYDVVFVENHCLLDGHLTDLNFVVIV